MTRKKICIIGKCPPLQGGTSVHTFWAACCLARAGHEVHLVSNANEAAECYRHVMLQDDVRFLSSTSQMLHLHFTSPITCGAFIPFAQPFASQLLGLAHSLSREISFDAYIGWYFEPYGLVASLLGRLANVPVFLRHAGSDLGRLILEPDLRSAAQLALAAPVRIITAPFHREKFATLGVPVERLIHIGPARLPDFHINAPRAFEIDDYRAEFSRWLCSAVGRHSFEDAVLSAKTPEDDVLRIGIYGKVGQNKGSFALLRALTDERVARLPFRFYSTVCGHAHTLKHYFETLASYEPLARKTVCLPPLPPWRVPDFLGLLDIVFCLENRFPIAFHSPILVREVLASGACLVCSREIVEKLPFRESVVPDRNMVVVDDPEEHEQLVRVVQDILQDKKRVSSIGRHGHFLSKYVENSLSERHPILQVIENKDTG